MTQANFLGLGWAATPAGLRAMEELAKLEEERREAETVPKGMLREQERKEYKRRYRGGRPLGREQKAVPAGVASNEMCTFLIINISSLQLISVNIIAYRSQYGSVNPAAIVGPGIVATFISTLTAIVYCKAKNMRRRA